MPIGPEHVGGAAGALAFAIEVVKQAGEILRRRRAKKKRPEQGSDKAEVTTNAEFRGEIHEFKRAMIAEAETQRKRYHGLRTLVSTLIGISSERRAARHEGREFDTGVYEIDLRAMERKLDEMPDDPLPQLSPPASSTRPTAPERPRPPLASPRPKPNDEGDPE